jgi:hypothetical protein
MTNLSNFKVSERLQYLGYVFGGDEFNHDE